MTTSRSVGELFVVSVPIGNLEDITLRAIRLLRETDLILCEDTRTTGKLLELLGLPKRPLLSVHEHNETDRLKSVLDKLRQGQRLVLVSDAGTPVISDPGERLVAGLIREGIRIVPIPGPCAAIAALSASGLPSGSFLFLGFPPQKPGALRRMLTAQTSQPHTLIFYVGPHHLLRFLEIASAVFGDKRSAVVGREITKKFEEFARGTLHELPDALKTVKGEVVVLIEGLTAPERPSEDDIEARLRILLNEGVRPTVAAKTLAKELGCSRDEVYQIGLKIKAGTH